MRKEIIKLLLLNSFLLIFAVGIYAVGYEYDKANKIHPEMYYFSDAGIMVYGKRWERVSKVLISTAVIIDIVAIMVLYRKRQSKNSNLLNLMEENK